MRCASQALGTVHNVLNKFPQDCERLAEEFDDAGALLTLSVDGEAAQALAQALADATAGKVELREAAPAATAAPANTA